MSAPEGAFLMSLLINTRPKQVCSPPMPGYRESALNRVRIETLLGAVAHQQLDNLFARANDRLEPDHIFGLLQNSFPHLYW
jgi:hypothetical protein